MKVDVQPLAISTVPDTGLLRLHGAWHPAAIHVLGQADVRDTCRILPNQVHMRVQKDSVYRFVTFGQRVFKVEPVKIMPLHQVSQSFRLKGSKTRIANLCISLKVAVVDGFNQLLCHLYDLLLSSFKVFILNSCVGTLCRLLVSVHWVVDHGSLWLQCWGGACVFGAAG